MTCFLVTFEASTQEIGLQLYSLRHEMKEDVSGTLKKIQSWGISNLEEGNGVHMDIHWKNIRSCSHNMI